MSQVLCVGSYYPLIFLESIGDDFMRVARLNKKESGISCCNKHAQLRNYAEAGDEINPAHIES
jgi:hypothetical protein